VDAYYRQGTPPPRVKDGTLAALDELFRAKFTVVRRVPESAFKS
jgi:hypothetical protein